MKKIIFVSLIVSLLILAGCMQSKLPSGKMADNFTDVEDLIKASPMIVSCTVTSSPDEFTYKEVEFANVSIEVDNIFRDEHKILKKKDELSILQTKIYEEPALKKGEELVLFIEPYIGPVTEDAYVIKGAYLGQFKLDKDKIIPINYEKGTRQMSISNEKVKETSISKLIKSIDKNKYTKEKVKTKDELKKEIENEENLIKKNNN